MKRGFGSDNHAAIHPVILQAIVNANISHAPSYGTDDWSEKASALFKKDFGASSETFFVFNGTAANVLALKACVQSYQSVLCSELSHLNVDECGAPEFFTGGKLIPLPQTDGKLQLSTLKQALIRRGDQHFSQVKAISLTQPTELGTCYSMNELREICLWAKSEKLLIHMDGARFANACVTLNASFKQLTYELGVDVLSFGGTKNGFLGAEAVVFLNPKLAENFKYIRKQSAQLPSKTRFLAAQFLAYLENNLWKDIAAHSLSMAKLLETEIKLHCPGIPVISAVESNAVFVQLQKAWIKPLREHSFFYVWDEKTFVCRLMTSWDTQSSDIHQFVEKLKQLTKQEIL